MINLNQFQSGYTTVKHDRKDKPGSFEDRKIIDAFFISQGGNPP